jgi:thiol-disulfide isomerase/thioredoxin
VPDTVTPPEDPPAPSPGRRRKGLPVGPLGMLVVTAIALAAALGTAALMNELLDEDPVDLQDALDETADAPLVLDTEVRAKVGSHAPDVRLEYLDGGVQQLAEVAGTGTPVVLNFWSSTCVPCLKEMPAFEQVRAEFEDELTIVGVDVTDTADAGNEMVERTGVQYRNARDPRAEIFAVFGGIALPRTVLIDGDGVVRATHSGELTVEELTDLLAEHDLVTS